jgi:hypothetical protein
LAAVGGDARSPSRARRGGSLAPRSLADAGCIPSRGASARCGSAPSRWRRGVSSRRARCRGRRSATLGAGGSLWKRTFAPRRSAPAGARLRRGLRCPATPARKRAALVGCRAMADFARETRPQALGGRRGTAPETGWTSECRNYRHLPSQLPCGAPLGLGEHSAGFAAPALALLHAHYSSQLVGAPRPAAGTLAPSGGPGRGRAPPFRIRGFAPRKRGRMQHGVWAVASLHRSVGLSSHPTD